MISQVKEDGQSIAGVTCPADLIEESARSTLVIKACELSQSSWIDGSWSWISPMPSFLDSLTAQGRYDMTFPVSSFLAQETKDIKPMDFCLGFA
jgi:hypothetical protein